METANAKAVRWIIVFIFSSLKKLVRYWWGGGTRGERAKALRDKHALSKPLDVFVISKHGKYFVALKQWLQNVQRQTAVHLR